MSFLEHRLTNFEATFKQNLEKEKNYVKKFQPITTFVAHWLINSPLKYIYIK
jgi:hypothetical protein